MTMQATQADIDLLNNKYQGRKAYFGDLHDHCQDGLPADGKRPISDWLPLMDELGMDFQVFVNHKQVYHMYLPQWDDTRFIGGTEPATKILDSKAENANLHYNLIAPNAQALEEVLMSVPKYNYTGGKDGIPVNMGRFDYVKFTLAEFQDIITKLKAKGGFFVHPHPKQLMVSDDPLDYWFADDTGLEIFYIDYRSEETKANYKLWNDLLALGKRLWATAGCDEHNLPTAKALSVIYSEEQKWSTFVSHLAVGDFGCGSVGVRMVVGDTAMGGHTDFAGKRVVISVGDWHKSSLVEGHTYRIDILSDKGAIYSGAVDPKETAYFAFDADESAKFYRVEIIDEMDETPIIAIGNPIWNN